MRYPPRWLLFLGFGGLLAVIVFILVVRAYSPQEREQEFKPVLSVDHTIESFFAAYWQRPIPLQGKPPVSFSEKEISLAPEACGSCHPQQYADWKESLHSKAMGPGPWGQIIDLEKTDKDQAVLCQTCHAPLSEQLPFSPSATSGNAQSYEKNPFFNPRLQLQGITCAACHVRQHQRFGPPRAEDTAATNYPATMANHGGVQRTPYFERAEFCKGCHQFDPETSVLVNGKPLQDTYREWKNSIWGQGEASCQECHMPNRRHLWKGIHDAEWVRGGVTMEAKLSRPPAQPHDSIELVIELKNGAVGHKFPTYATPKVFVKAALLDGRGRMISTTRKEEIIGWDARFENGEWRERFDTRILPGETSHHSFRWKLPPEARKIRAWVEIHPDHFYHVHFYPPYLKDKNLSPAGRKLIEKALEESGRSSYILFEQTFPLDGS